jgi:hypothetical protein
MRWLWLSWYSSARAAGTRPVNDNAAAQQSFITWRIRIIPANNFVELRSRRKAEHSREGTRGKSQTAGQDVMRGGAFAN